MDAVYRHIRLKSLRNASPPPPLPWFDSETHHLLNKKETARRKAKLNSSNHRLWENFRYLRRACKSLVSRKGNEFFQALPSLMKSSTKKFCSLFKSVSSPTSIPSKMSWKHDDKTLTAKNPEEIANLLNNYFYSMFSPPIPQDDDTHPVSTTNFCNPISDIEISPDAVRRVHICLDDSYRPRWNPSQIAQMLCSSYLFIT